jgi:adenylosuccinate lyase
MIPRYTRPEMSRIWSDENRFQRWLDVELAVADAEAEAGLIPAAAAATLRAKARFDVARIFEVEREVKHDVIAFTTVVAESLARTGDQEAARFLHYGLTSNDVVDTAQALLIAEASAQIQAGLLRLGEVLMRRAYEFRDTPTIGRTHGIHAEPTTFGLKIANWWSENQRNQERFRAAAAALRVGKLSGAVGTFAHLNPAIEERVCAKLGLRPAEIASQVIERDRHAHFAVTLAVIGGSLERIALEVRHLQRTEVREAWEHFGAGQKGSSAMPHKKNPIVSEQICGLARILRGNAQAAMENQALWHERDISHSSVERIILADSTILMDYLLDRTASLIENLGVSPARMMQNLESTQGLIFSGQLLLDLVEKAEKKGVTRETAYSWVQRNAMKAWETGGDFRAMAAADPDIAAQLTPAEIAASFDLQRQLHNVGAIFERLFGR